MFTEVGRTAAEVKCRRFGRK